MFSRSCDSSRKLMRSLALTHFDQEDPVETVLVFDNLVVEFKKLDSKLDPENKFAVLFVRQ